ncbi:isocitrate lyase/phosphoenolpyruvate mutase family protein [Rhodobacteraceae bacterium B1Z28]|uniref:Isocitrate lyase/phosphoenolpyruvate mutase family protein n=1 Tax=Ruegeria haliotis TaxID=2747601 RepID=A0ABX2PL19_9RHOB|nr:isocitrate lyase/phosphoenolpyruvate mutase family protein [Ruegeria haliotis]NVO54810.1 isocitrate lyase/phosphoenolpyruvate mutase family protein [Ruegeria haliotis]
MTDQARRAESFADLHKKGDPVILFNIWDAGSAAAVRDAGAQAIATGSAPVAMAQGFADGQKIPLEVALDNAKRIVNAVDLPVSLDFEGAYAQDPAGIAENVSRALDCGVVGFNFEDQIIGGEGLYPVVEQATRIEAMRRACEAASVPVFINARTDIFLKAPADTHDDAMLDEAIARAAAFEAAGASGFFAPGLKDEALIERLCAATALPVNIIALPGTPETPRLAALGVARVSYGPVPYRRMIAWLTEQAQDVMKSAD